MTSPSSTQSEKSAIDHAQTFFDWTRINSKALTIGGAIVLAAAVVFWFYARSQQLKAVNAQTALMNAKQSLTSGNMQLAQTDLQSVFSRYGSTQAGVEAAMLLATAAYDANKPQDGITILEKAAGSSAASSVQGTIHSLEGDGYAQMGKLADAAKQYETAADAANGALEKAFYQSKAARAYQASGDTAKARSLWTTLSNDPNASMTSEARVRLGELSAQPAKR
jgi:predicted negative regulator of RcsB-dependent stress response